MATTTAKSGYEWKYGEAVEFDGMAIQVEAPVADPEAPYVENGNTVWVLLVTIANKRAEPLEYWPMDYTLVDDTGFVYECGTTASTKDNQHLDHGALLPGRTVRGYVACEIPTTASPYGVKYDSYMETEEWLALWSE